MSSYPFVQTSSVFNTSDYNVLNEGLTIETANALYLSLNGGIISGSLNVAGNLDCTTLTVGGLSLNVDAITGVTEGICSASKALIVDSSRNINNINSLTSTTLTASSTLTLGATSISETEIGFLDGVSTAGTIYASKVITVNSSSQINSNLQLATSRKILMNNSASSGAYIDMGNTASDRCISLFSDALSYYGFGANGSALRSFSRTDFAWYTGATQSVIGTSIMTLNSAGLLTTASLTATSITGTLQTAAQPNITSIGTLASLTATSITGTLQTAAQPNITSIGTLTSLTATSITGTLQTAAQPNITSIGTLTSLTATSITGTLQTAAQPNITSIGTLASLTATSITGTLQTAAQPNITSIGTLASLTATSITGTLQTAAQPNITSIGTLTSLTATSITGTLQTAAQPNITSIGTLTSLNVSGVSSTSNTRITTTTNYNGIMDTASIVLKQSSTTNGNKVGIDFVITTNTIDNANTATCSITHERILAYVGDLVFNTKRTGTATSPLIEALRISSTGTCSIANTSSGFQLDLGGSGTGINTNALTTTSLTLGATAITASGSEINVLTGITPGTVLASRSVVVDSNKDITGFRRLSVGGTTGIMQINALTGGDAAIRLGSSEAVNKCWTIQYLTATNLLRFDAFGSNSSITLTPAGDLTSKASFDTLAYKLNGVAITMSALTSITLGTAAASKALTLDASSNITGIVGLTATNLTGTLQTAAQPNITSLGSLASLTTSSLTLGGTAITASAAELNYCDLAGSAGTAEANKVMTLDASKNIATLNLLTSNYLTANLAINSPNATANLSTLNLNGIATNYGVASIKGNATLNSPSFATTNSVIYMESSNATPITAEFGLSSGTGATSTNGLKLGTLSNNDFSLFTNAGTRMVIKANASIGLGSNASTADKTLCLLDGTAGVTTTSFRIGNTLTTNNCMSMEWICSGGSGSGGNGLHFNPYGTSDAMVINCNGYVGIGGNGLYPLDIFSYRTSTVVAPYALSESTTASYVVSPNLSGQNISLNCLHSALFLEKVFISSDRRLKKNIAPINLKVARQFLNVQPVVYHKREQADNDMLNFGYIAQDIMKNSIGELLCHVDNDNMKIEEDGDIPGIQFNVQYDKVAPLLHVIVKEHDNIIEKLKSKINNLEEILKKINW